MTIGNTLILYMLAARIGSIAIPPNSDKKEDTKNYVLHAWSL